MTTGAETTLIDQWIEATLSAASAVTDLVGTRIYADVAPPNIEYPFVVYQLQSPDDVRGVSSARILTSTLYVVKAVSIGTNFNALQPVVEAIDGVLHQASGPVTGGQVLACVRERPFRLVEVNEGNTYRHLGGEYRIQVQGA